MFKIDNTFEGANCKILSITPDKVCIEVDLRDTVDDWFFWSFKVENANGRTITFEFPSVNRVGYFGSAISYDYKNWFWKYSDPAHNGNSFTYTFGQDEKCVYFAHDFLYRPQRFYEFALKQKIELKTLCESEKGRIVPYFETDSNKETIFLTARHHACESTGNYILEGVIQSLLNEFGDKYKIVCVPFVDFDGVTDGDQGKNRNSHDHNRDYTQTTPAVYNTVRAITNLAKKLKIKYAFDFHSPWHLSNDNDKLLLVFRDKSKIKAIETFSLYFEEQNNKNCLPHYQKDDILPDTLWNNSNFDTFIKFMDGLGAELSFSIETPYFLCTNTAFSVDKAIETGHNFVKALSLYDKNQSD